MAPKRPNAAGPSNPKRTRFAASPAVSSSSHEGAADDSTAQALLEADLPEGGQRTKQRAKRQLKDKEGYGSDSSNDDEGVVPSRRAKGKGIAGGVEDEDEEMDMFADDVDMKATAAAAELEKAKGKGKDKEFMDLNEIEGQEFGRTPGAEMEDDDLASNPDADAILNADSDAELDENDEEGRTRRRMEGLDGDMGYEMTGFNMKTEMDEGKFTADGETYVSNDKDEGEKHDVWLTDMDKEEIRKARKAHKERERIEEERQKKEEGGADGGKARREEEQGLMREAIQYMERGETVLEALERLGREAEDKRKKEEKEKGGKKLSWAEKQKERKAASSDQTTPFARLSAVVSSLTTIGQLDVYALSRESMQRMLPVERTNGISTVPEAPRDTRAFQYRFSLPYVRALPEAQRPVEREVFGPFTQQQLSQWRNTGFFGGPACENVELRAVAASGPGIWGSWADIVGR